MDCNLKEYNRKSFLPIKKIILNNMELVSAVRGSGVTEGKPDKDPACIPFPADDSDVCFSGGIPLCCNSIRNTGTSQRYLHCRFGSSWKKYLLNLFYMYAISQQMHFAHK